MKTELEKQARADKTTKTSDQVDALVIPRPRIICICGSTRFADIHAIKRWDFEKDGGAICLMINYLPGWYAEKQGWNGNDHFGEQEGNKEILDELHFRKIDLADEVYVINWDGYIGNSTRREIEYAEKTGKPVKYMFPDDQPEIFIPPQPNDLDSSCGV